jgi:hypothetical protein
MRINFRQLVYTPGEHIPALRIKSAGDRIPSEHHRHQIVAYVQSHIDPFLRYMDVSVTTRFREEVLRNHNVLIQYAEYLTENRILTCKVYYWQSPRACDDEYIALGLDIAEDELYTLLSLTS